MTPSQLTAFLERLISEELTISSMIWGPPGIGKSSILNYLSLGSTLLPSQGKLNLFYQPNYQNAIFSKEIKKVDEVKFPEK